MNFWEKNKVLVICVIALIIMVGSVFLWNAIAKKQNEDKKTDNTIDVSDANNITSVEAKLGSDIKITQGYLINYTIRKSSVWYMSSGYVKNIKKDDKIATITLSKDKNSKKTITATIEVNKCDIKKGDLINFVGTIDLKTKVIELSKISNDIIDYKNVTELELEELIDNIDAVKDNYFIVSGYMVTEEDRYKLFDTKEAYNKDSSVGTYFTLSWKDKFNYTGNQKVNVKCKLEDTYKLNECELIN